MRYKKFYLEIIFLAATTVVSCFEATDQPDQISRISVSTSFISGGGSVNVISSDPAIIRFKPHKEKGKGGWGNVWWYFMVEGLTFGEEIILQLDRGEPLSSGITPQASFSYDQKDWGFTDTGEPAIIEGREFFIYKHKVRGQKVWFAYNIPYTPEHIDLLLIPEAIKVHNVEVFELCKTKNNRSVKAFKFDDLNKSTDKKYGIMLFARTHAFETGSSWVLHELTLWLLSNDPLAVSLRKCAKIFIIPIVDVDGVVEGRNGKGARPHDHNSGWDEEPAYWPEQRAIELLLNEMAEQNMVDMYINFHGPGNYSHPYFICSREDLLPYEKQRLNRAKFFEVLNSPPMDEVAKLSQSMAKIHYSARPKASQRKHRENDHTISLTIEVNMMTPLSTQAGYRSTGIELGRAISKYFTNGYHQK